MGIVYQGHAIVQQFGVWQSDYIFKAEIRKHKTFECDFWSDSVSNLGKVVWHCDKFSTSTDVTIPMTTKIWSGDNLITFMGHLGHYLDVWGTRGTRVPHGALQCPTHGAQGALECPTWCNTAIIAKVNKDSKMAGNVR